MPPGAPRIGTPTAPKRVRAGWRVEILLVVASGHPVSVSRDARSSRMWLRELWPNKAASVLDTLVEP